jgi:diguanylate cyclase (GGDEF)-like protein
MHPIRHLLRIHNVGRRSVSTAFANPGARNIILVSVLATAVIWLGAWHLAGLDARRAEDGAFRDTANLARAFEEHIIRLIKACDQILLFARSSFGRDPTGFSLKQWAHDQNFANDVTLQIAIADKTGILTASNLPLSPKPTSIRDREHFRVHADTARDELYISKPVMGRISGKWSIHLSRRISADDGSFLGIITIAIDPYYLGRFYESVDLNRNGMVLLAGLDGIVRARVSGASQTVGQSIRNGMLFKRLSFTPIGSYVTDGKLDGHRRLTSYRSVRGLPLVVAVGLAETDVFASIGYTRRLYFLAAAMMSILVLAFMAMLVRRQIAMQRARDKLWETANVDALTKLANRNRLNDTVNAIVANPSAKNERFALLLFDLDNFKFINDTLGHEAGDIVLRTAAKRIKRTSRDAYFVARLGGDEFAVVLRNPSSQGEIEDTAQRILQALQQRVNYRGHGVQLSTSIGIACFPDHSSTWNDVFRAADLALYRAKRDGRNRFAVFHPEMLVEAENQFRLLESVRLALKRDHVVPFYQAKVAIKTGEVVGFEAVARIVHYDGRVDLPEHFVSTLADAEISRAFGLRMVERVARDMRTWQELGLDIKGVAINVSTTELRAGDYAERVLAILEANRIPAQRFEVEVTETAAFDDETSSIRRNLDILSTHNISIALDDFGTGFASLTHLKSLPISQVKIDQSFVANILTDTECRAIVDATVRLSHSLGKIVVAEGVESRAQLAAVGKLGCDIAQGFLFSKPIPFDEVHTFLLQHRIRNLASPRIVRSKVASRLGVSG